MKKMLFIAILGIMFMGANAQVKDLTGSGQTPAGGHTYYFYDAVSELGTPFTMHANLSLGGGLIDTVTITTEYANIVGNGWDAFGTSHVIKIADSTAVWTDTLWGRNIRFKCVTSATSTKGKFYLRIFYGNLK